jgi:diguanylate cyclase (GGDEF)-like protein
MVAQRTNRDPRWLYVAGFALAIAGYAAIPLDTWLQTAWQVVVGFAAAGTIVAVVRRSAPAAATAWLWCAAGIALNATGSFAEAFIARVLHNEDWPTPASLFYQSIYVAFAIGLVLLIRRRSRLRDWSLLVDTTTIAVGLGLLSWVFLIHPAIQDGSVPLLARLDSIGPPLGDVVLLSMLARLLLDGAPRSLTLRMVAASLTLFLAGDLAWAVTNQLGVEPGAALRHVLDMTFLTAYASFGAAALYDRTRDSSPAATARPLHLRPPMLVLLTAASLIAPGILAVEVARGRITDGVAIVLGCTALFLLVIGRMAQMLRHIERQAAQLHELALNDELTGLPNRRVWNAELPRALERARRDGRPLAVGVLDLDHFKRFNDVHGHLAGDQFLKAAGSAWSRHLRAVDLLARFGGEEFVVLLPGVDAVEASAILERLRESVPTGQTVSVGVALWNGYETSDELVARADRALYAAKQTGRNRLCLAGAPR